jgi:PadR family transcriptional regulator AphA
VNLTVTSYIVLGLIDSQGESTPYELKQVVKGSIGNFWSLQHAQLYSEPERLATAEYLRERREETGRRRKRYSITQKGRRALREWRDTPTDELLEFRDPGLLKLFFGADPAPLAEAQLAAHRRKLAEYEALEALDSGRDRRGPWIVLEAGIAHEREYVRFWERLCAKPTPQRAPRPRSSPA